jgi:hypothetical protein
LDAAKLLLWPKGPPATEPARYRRFAPWEWLQVENQELDRLHVLFLALAVRNREIAQQLGEATRFEENELSSIWLRHELIFDLNCLWQLVGTPDDPAPPRPYPEVANLVSRLRAKYWSQPLRQTGRPKLLPLPFDDFLGISELRRRFAEVTEVLTGRYREYFGRYFWSSDEALSRLLDEDRFRDAPNGVLRFTLRSAQIPLSLLRDPETSAFVLDRLRESPTRAAVTVGFEIAKTEYGYKGKYDSFYRGWLRAKRRRDRSTPQEPL